MRRGRLGLSTIDKREIWSRWKAGETLHEIGRAYGKCHNTIRAVLLPRGGIPPLARRRSRLALSFAERENLSRGMACGSSMREIARHLHRATSTVSREVARHGGRSAYRAYDADQQAWNAALRPKRYLLAVNSELRDVVASKLILDWSPEQIAGWLKAQYQPVHSSAWSAEKRAAGPSALEAAHATLASCQRTWTSPRADRRCHFDPGTSRRSGRSSDSRPLGRRSTGGWKEQLYCDTRGTALPF
jgi:IS30 family transposase